MTFSLTAEVTCCNPSSKFSMCANLVSVGELGSLVEEELQGGQAASSAGPVDRCGLQLKDTSN